VEEDRVGGFSVLTEALAMVPDHADDGVVQEVVFIEVAQKLRDDRVRESDLCGVQIIGETPAKLRRRVIGLMGVVEVEPAKEGLAASATFKPFERGGESHIPWAFGYHSLSMVPAAAEVVVVVVE
jgi:hypothetical protein